MRNSKRGGYQKELTRGRAEQVHAESQCHFKIMCLSGEGVSNGKREAMGRDQCLAEQGYASAQFIRAYVQRR